METLEELLLYCEDVAGSVGLMLLPILAEEALITPALKTACLHLGCGMQLTNILRDVGEDIRSRNRIYLPETLLKKHGLSPHILRILSHEKKPPRIPEGFKSLFEELSSLSSAFYSSVFDCLPAFKKEAALPLLCSAMIYRAIEDVIREKGYNSFSEHTAFLFFHAVEEPCKLRIFVQHDRLPAAF